MLAGPNVNTGKVVGQAPGQRLDGEPLAGEVAWQNEGHAGRLGLEAGVEVCLSGHQAVAANTWDRYRERFFSLLEETELLRDTGLRFGGSVS